VAAVSVGGVAGEERLDLAYLEDRDAHVDANVVMLEPARYVEVQGTGENDSFSRAQFDVLLDLAGLGITALFRAQREALGW
jgi:ribonuclease PH